MYFVYSLLLCLGFLILLPRFVIDAFRHGKYVAGFRERLGSVSPFRNEGRPVIWLHSVSVGETQAARPLVKAIKARFPNHSIIVSTTTATGQRLAREIFKDDVERVFYFPFDWRWTVRRTLNAARPGAVLLMETELWPGFLRECERRKIPVAIVNGRLSDQSFRRYRLIKGFMRRVLGSLNMAIMQTEADAERVGALGMNESKTYVAGNLKFDAGALPTTDAATTEFRQRFQLKDAPVILAASTHGPEERLILEAFKRMKALNGRRPRLIIAPRHPERFSEVAELINATGFRWTRRSAPADGIDGQCEVILLDSIGELQAFYPLATVVFVGGSIAKTGGHNILEPAAVGACVVTGPYTFNFRLIVETFIEAGAVIQLAGVPEPESFDQLAQVFSELISDPSRRHELGKRAQNLVKRNRGATERTLELLEPMIGRSQQTLDSLDIGVMDTRALVLMMPLSTLYRAVNQVRLAAYRRGLFRTSKLPVPVISVGNITTGGTGKTPLVEWVCRTIAGTSADGNAESNARVKKNICVLTRGYGKLNPAEQVLVSDGTRLMTDEPNAGDEAQLLATNLLGIAAVISNPDRVAAGEWAIPNLGTGVFVLDDAFQHLRIARDLDVVAVDATNPFGGGELLPNGRLREPLAGLSRADCVVITRSDQVDDVGFVTDALREFIGDRPVFVSRMVTSGLRRLNGEKFEAADSVDSTVAAFCGVGNPDSFFTQVRNAGLEVSFSRTFPDHYRYSQADIDALIDQANASGAKALITTAKDATKLGTLDISLPCYVLEIRISIDDDARLAAMIQTAVSGTVG